MADAEGIPLRRVVLVGAALAATVALGIVAVLAWLHLIGLPPGGARLPPASPQVEVATPRLEPAPQAVKQAVLARQQQALQGLGWVDATQGVAHIPIEQAMALQAARAASAAGAGAGR